MSATLALRAAIVAHLRADAQLVALLSGQPRVYDFVPEPELFPYVQVRTEARAWDTDTDYGHEHAVEINVWSAQTGRRECDLILGRLELAMRNAALSPTGHRLVNLRWEMAAVTREDGGLVFFGYARWRAVTEEL